ncbi:MAG: adenine deaminase [Treponema sp.]|jgi:adenine deaminase|nr:adenine deaminase [Treponema sp.]
MEKPELKKLIDTAAGRRKADLIVRNGILADVYGGRFVRGDLVLCEGRIAALVTEPSKDPPYEGKEILDAGGAYVLPGFIESHIHIESAMVSPAELGRLLVPHGTTTIVADPHEIVNVAGLPGFYAMVKLGKEALLDIKYMIPSCVPSTAFEYSGAVLDAAALEPVMEDENVFGMGEFMDYPAVIKAEDGALAKILLAKNAGKLIDGHSPKVRGKDLNAYIAAGIHTDHECATVEEMEERISRGMYVMLRQGSACHDLRNLLKGLSAENSRRCVLCSDDRQPRTILEEGHLDRHLQICIEEGIDPMSALRMATLNAAECFRLEDRGALAPGLRADIVLVEDLKSFKVKRVYIEGKLAAEGGCLSGTGKTGASSENFKILKNSFHVRNFSEERLVLTLKSDSVYVIDVKEGSVVTGKGTASVKRNSAGEFVYSPGKDISKIAVIERHHDTGRVGLGLFRGYGIREGAVAVSVSHDSHNIITVGVNDGDMALAVERLIEMEGGIALVKDGKVLEDMPLPLGGLMSDRTGEWVDGRLEKIHECAWNVLGVKRGLEPVMSLAFMSLVVIPELKVSCGGLFDVGKFSFIEPEVP